MLLLILSAVLILAFTIAASRNAQMVPGRLQFAGETVYGFVRNTLARDNIGSEHFMKFVPYLFSLFMFILVNNYYGIFPFLQFPTMSRIGFVIPLALMSWLIYVGAGMWKHGVFGYFKHATMPSGVGGPILILLVPLEFFSNILVRPVTLTLRLFGNMFAGHLLLILFATGVQRVAAGEQVLTAEREQDQQDVAGEHVGEQSQGQRDRPDEDVGEELQRDQQRAGSVRDPAGIVCVLEVADEAVLPDADRVVDEPAS